MNWYNRMLLSYAPIFFVIISTLIFVFFTALNSSSQNKYVETNRAILQQMVQYTDANLQLIERNIVSEFYSDATFQSFFEGSPQQVYDYYLMQRTIRELASSFPFDTAIYLYNDQDKEFLTTTKRDADSVFTDMDYFRSAYNSPVTDSWSNPREFRQFDLDQPVKVVSLLKYYPYMSIKQGAIVVNVSVDSIIEEMNRLNNTQISIVIAEENGQRVGPNAESVDQAMVVVSPYTGWQFYASSTQAEQYSALTMLSNIWVLFGFAVIILSIVWFTVVTHINYKPIQTIMGKIGDYTARRSDNLGVKTPRNELKLIEGAIDHLLERTIDYDHLHSEGRLLRQRNLFHDLLTGYRSIKDEEWTEQMLSFGLTVPYTAVGVIVMEIDHYPKFTERYNPGDQYLIKYIIETSLQELSEQKGMFIWHAWVHPNMLAVVAHMADHHQPYNDSLKALCNDYRIWINDHLQITLSVGIGEVVDSISRVAKSYREASSNVSYKVVFGTNTIVDPQLAGSKTGNKYNWYQPLVEVAYDYRMDGDWVNKLNAIFGHMQQTLLSQSDMSAFMDNLAHHLSQAIGTLSPQIQELWRSAYIVQLNQIAGTAETLEECQKQLLTVLMKLSAEVEKERYNRMNHSIAVKIKAYIDHHYADPNLSLNQVSEMFGSNPKSVSMLFKEELGDKFIDYLLKVRFDHAKRMLKETDEPIQPIAEKVGYTHVISFHRAFKKLFDMTPGEYRSLYRNVKE